MPNLRARVTPSGREKPEFLWIEHETYWAFHKMSCDNTLPQFSGTKSLHPFPSDHQRLMGCRYIGAHFSDGSGCVVSEQYFVNIKQGRRTACSEPSFAKLKRQNWHGIIIYPKIKIRMILDLPADSETMTWGPPIPATSSTTTTAIDNIVATAMH